MEETGDRHQYKMKPRVAFVVQRAGKEVVGGAESLCLQIAQRMSIHWNTEVITTCARDYSLWDNYYPEGVEEAIGTVIRRFRVDHPRNMMTFDQMSAEIIGKGREASLKEQEEWMRSQGPCSAPLLTYLDDNRERYDAWIFFGYLYATTYFGLPIVQERAILAPLAHDEWPIHFPMWDKFFTLPRSFIFQTPEEREFLSQRFSPLDLLGQIAGIGIKAPANIPRRTFRRRYALDGPFILYAGRVDASKGCAEMIEAFLNFRSAGAIKHKLVLIGKEVMPVPYNENIIYLDFLPEEEKWAAMATCDWLLVPSPYESLSIALLETWSVARPAIVNAKAEVLKGHCERSHGGLWYHTWNEFATILQIVDGLTKDRLGLQGLSYVREHYAWERIESQYLEALRGLRRIVD